MTMHQWKNIARTLGLGLVTLAGTSTVRAGDSNRPIDALENVQDTGRVVFKMIDENNDGQISQKEAIDAGNLAIGGFFFRADTNGDGVVSQDEARAARENLLAQKPLVRFMIERIRTANPKSASGTPDADTMLMSLVDGNNDRQLQATEVRQAIQTVVQGVFATADTNRDGLLSPVEVNAAIVGAVKAAELAGFQTADTNRDGQISKVEFEKALTNPANDVFAILDANNDGQLSQQELQSAGRIIEDQIKRTILPESPNSARHLLQSGQKMEQVSPVPTIAVPAPGRPATAPAPR